MPEPTQKEFDVFISYSHSDRNWVKNELVPRLENIGLRVCIDYKISRAGYSLSSEINRAISLSRRAVAILTPDFVNSDWTNYEQQILHHYDKSGERGLVIPIYLKPCKVPVVLRHRVSINMFDPENRELEWKRLLKNLGSKDNGISTERRKIGSTKYFLRNKAKALIIAMIIALSSLMVTALVIIYGNDFFTPSNAKYSKLTIRVFDENTTDIISSGKIYADIGLLGRRETTINPNGEAIFLEIPQLYFEKGIYLKIIPDIDGYEAFNPDSTYELDNLIYYKVKREISAPLPLMGRTVDDYGQGLGNVKIGIIGSKIKTLSDSHGNFSMRIPFSYGSTVLVWARKDGYEELKELQVLPARIVEFRLKKNRTQ
ncbi:MAG: toll/interleukin-1 receptor domain-containing protein [bacterium]